MEHIRAAIAANVRARAARCKVRQETLAAALDLSQPAMSRRMSGLVSFAAEELSVVAAVLETDVESLLAISDQAVPA